MPLKVYFSITSSHITFGLEIYGSTRSNTNLESIFVFQKRANYLMLNLNNSEPLTSNFAK